MTRVPAALLPLLAAVAGALVYLASEALVPAGLQTFSYGVDYQTLSADPGALQGSLPHRMLGPLLAWLCGFGGAGYPQFQRVCGAVLLATVFWCTARRGAALDALLVTLAVAATGAVQTYKTVVGFPDQLSFALLLLAHAAARRPVWFWLLNGASLLNHEMLVFFAPWLLWERRRAGGRLRDDAIGAVVVGALYVVFRLWIAAHAPQATLDARWYAGKSLFPLGTLWLWLLSLVYWALAFGPLLVVVGFAAHARPRRDHAVGLVLFIAAILGIYAVVWVYDFFRIGSAICVPLVLGAPRLLAAPRGRPVLLALTALACGNWCLWHPASLQLANRPGGYVLPFGVDGITMQCLAQPGGEVDPARLFTCALPQVWPLFAGCALGVLACAVVGAALARRWRGAAT